MPQSVAMHSDQNFGSRKSRSPLLGSVPENPWLVVVGGGGGEGADFSGRTFLGFHAAAARRMADPHTFLSLIPDRKDSVGKGRGLINFIYTKAKCRHLKKLTCKGTLRQVFI